MDASRCARPTRCSLAQPFGVPSLFVKSSSTVGATLCGPTHVPGLVRPFMGRQRPDRECHLILHPNDGHIIRPTLWTRDHCGLAVVSSNERQRENCAGVIALSHEHSNDRGFILKYFFDRWASLYSLAFLFIPDYTYTCVNAK